MNPHTDAAKAWEDYQAEAHETMRLFEDVRATPLQRSLQMAKADAAYRAFKAAFRKADRPCPQHLERERNWLAVEGAALWFALLAYGMLVQAALNAGGGWIYSAIVGASAPITWLVTYAVRLTYHLRSRSRSRD